MGAKHLNLEQDSFRRRKNVKIVCHRGTPCLVTTVVFTLAVVFSALDCIVLKAFFRERSEDCASSASSEWADTLSSVNFILC